MSEEATATPAPVSVDATASAPPEQPPKLSGKQRAMARLHPAPAPSAAPESVPADSSPVATEPRAAAHEPEHAKHGAEAQEGDAPQQEPGEPVAQYKARLVRAMADLRKRDQTLRERDQSLQSIQAERDKVSKDLEAIREKLKDPFSALKLAGTSYEELTRKYLAKEVSIPDEASSAVREHVDERTRELETKLSELTAWKERAEAERLERENAAAEERKRAEHLNVVTEIIHASSDKFPLLHAFPRGANTLLAACYEQQNGDPTQVAPLIEDAIRTDVLPILSSPKALAALIKSEPKLRETLLAALGGAQPSRKAQPEAGPRALAADVVSAPTNPEARPQKRSISERRKAALAVFTRGR